MTKKELVIAMYATAYDWATTAGGYLQSFYDSELGTVRSSLRKHSVDYDDWDSNPEVDWEKVVYQIIYDLEFEWWSDAGDQCADGPKELSGRFCEMARKEGFHIGHTMLNPAAQKEAFEEQGMEWW